MTHSAFTTPRRRVAALVITLAVAWTGAYTLTSAQTPEKRALTAEDYTRWRSISGQEMSSDGAWVAYVLQFTNTAPADAKPVLHLLKLDSNQDVSVPNATGAVFSSDAKWLAYQVDPSGGRGGRGGGGRAGGGGAQPAAPAPAAPADTNGQNAQGRGRAAATPAAPRHVELRNLATSAIQQWQDIQSFSFSPTAAHLLLRRRPATADGARGGANADNAGGGGGGGGQAAGGAAAATEATGARRRGDSAQPGERPEPVARERRRLGVQSRRGSPRVHGRRSGQGQQWPVRNGSEERTRHHARQRRQGLQPHGLERERERHRGPEGRRRRQNARAQQRARRLSQRHQRRSARRRARGARSGEGRGLSGQLGRERPRGPLVE